MTLKNNERFTITEIEVWKITGDLPQGSFGTKSKWKENLTKIEVPKRWQNYKIHINESNKLGEG